MRRILYLLAVICSINIYASDDIVIELQNSFLTAADSEIVLNSKLNGEKPLKFEYKYANIVSPKVIGKKYNMMLYCNNMKKDIQISEKLFYQDIYDNIDLTVYKKGTSIKYDFIVYPQGNPMDIQIEVSQSIKLKDGKIDFLNYNGLSELSPHTYQIKDGRKHTIDSRFEVKNNTISFSIGSYDKSLPLVIDPEIVFSSILGGNSYDYGGHLAKDSKGNIYHAFQTEASFLSNDDAINNKQSGRNICIMKYNSNMDVQWGMYLGGGGTSHVMDIKCDSEDNIWIGGETNSSGYPTTVNAVRSYVAGYFDMVLTKISPDGDILYSTIFGGGAYDVIAEIDIDSKDNVWATGRSSGGFSITSGAQPFSGDYDGFIFGVSAKGNLLLSTFIGTSDSDIAEGIAVDSEDYIYVSGHTFSSYFPTFGKNSMHYSGNRDAFLLKYHPEKGLIWSTYFGGEASDWGSNLEIDDFDNIYLSGYTSSYNLPNSINYIQNGNSGNMDMYLSKFNTDGKNIWSTFYGGAFEEGYNTTNDMYGGIDIDANGDIVWGGRTKSSNIPMFGSGGKHQFSGNQDGVVILLDSDGNPIWSSFIGGSGYEENIDVLFDSQGNILCTGSTQSSNFPVTDNPYNKRFSSSDAYIIRFGGRISSCHQSEFEMGIEPASSFVLNDQASYLNDTLFMHTQNSYAKGSVWYHKLLPVDVGFTTEFKFRITRNDDFQHFSEDNVKTEGGLAFVIQNAATNAIGATAQGLGYDGIPEGIAIEFDTYKDDENSSEDMNDPSKGHISVMGMLNGAISANHDAQKTFANVELKDDSTVYQCKIKYDGKSQKLRILFAEAGKTLEEVIQLNIDLTYSIDLKNNMGAYLGFTAANGNALQTHDIFDWKVCPDPLSTETSYGDYAGSDANVFVFPNPTHDNITIHYAPEKLSYTNINLYDLIGKKISMLYSGLDEAGEQTISMPLPDNLATGVYIIEVDYGYRKESVKVIVE